MKEPRSCSAPSASQDRELTPSGTQKLATFAGIDTQPQAPPAATRKLDLRDVGQASDVTRASERAGATVKIDALNVVVSEGGAEPLVQRSKKASPQPLVGPIAIATAALALAAVGYVWWQPGNSSEQPVQVSRKTRPPAPEQTTENTPSADDTEDAPPVKKSQRGGAKIAGKFPGKKAPPPAAMGWK